MEDLILEGTDCVTLLRYTTIRKEESLKLHLVNEIYGRKTRKHHEIQTEKR